MTVYARQYNETGGTRVVSVIPPNFFFIFTYTPLRNIRTEKCSKHSTSINRCLYYTRQIVEGRKKKDQQNGKFDKICYRCFLFCMTKRIQYKCKAYFKGLSKRRKNEKQKSE